MIESVVKSALQSAELQAFVGFRVFPSTFMQKDEGLPRWPAIRYTIIDAVNAPTVCGTGDQDTDDTRVQVDVVADTLRELNQIVPLVVTSMQSTDPVSVRDAGPRYTFDEETRTHRAIVDFVFYASEPQGS